MRRGDRHRRRLEGAVYERDDNSIANLEYELLEPPLNALDDARRLILTEIEDNRTWHPEGNRRPVGVTASRAARSLSIVTNPGSTRSSIAFANPPQIPVCARRARRREVLFALNRTGRGAMSRKRRRTWRSDISCKH